MIKTIIFDLGGVLLSDAIIYSKNEYTDFSETLKLTGINKELVKKIWRKHWQKMKYGEEDIDSFWEEFSSYLKKGVSLDEVIETYNSQILIKMDIFEFVKKLKKKYLLLALANESKKGIDFKINKFKLNNIFSKIYCSAYLHMAKPNKDIFEYVIKDSDINVDEVIFIDNQIENVNVAKKLGIKSILFRNLEQLKRDLTLLSINLS